MTVPSLKLLIPERHGGRWRSGAHHAAHSSDGRTSLKASKYPINSLSLEVVKQIWSAYPTLNIQNKSWESRHDSPSSNSLGLDLGPVIHVPICNVHTMPPGYSVSALPAEPQHNTFNMIASEPPGSDGHASNVLDAVDADADASNTLLMPETMLGAGPEREPGEVWEETPSATKPLRPPSRGKMSAADQPMLEEARAALMDSFMKNARIHDRGHRMSDDDLRINYAEKMTDEEVRHFVALGKTVMDDLKRTGKLNDVRRKYGHLQDPTQEATRNTKPRLDEQLENRTSGSSQSFDTFRPPTAPRAMRSVPRASPQPRQKQDSAPPRNFDRTAMSNSPPPARQRFEGTPSRRSSECLVPVLSKLPPTGSITAPSEPTTSTINLPVIPLDVILPRIILAKQGREFADTIQATFELDERLLLAAQRWTNRAQRFDVSEQHMCLYLTSVSAQEADAAYKALPSDPPPSLLPEMVSTMDAVWPPDGSFFVLINENRPEGISYTHRSFTPGSPPLNISNALVPGQNTIKLVQLHGHADVLFLIVAIPPSDDEIREEILWHKHFGDDPKPGEIIKVHFRL